MSKTQISYITKMPWFCIHYCIYSSSATLMVSCFPCICLVSILMQLRFLQILNCCWLLSVIDGSLLTFLSTSERYSENIPPKSGPLTSSQWNLIDFKWRDPIEWFFPHSDLIMLSTCKVKIEQLLWRLLIVDLSFNITSVDSSWVFESSTKISKLFYNTHQSID